MWPRHTAHALPNTLHACARSLSSSVGQLEREGAAREAALAARGDEAASLAEAHHAAQAQAQQYVMDLQVCVCVCLCGGALQLLTRVCCGFGLGVWAQGGLWGHSV